MSNVQIRAAEDAEMATLASPAEVEAMAAADPGIGAADRPPNLEPGGPEFEEPSANGSGPGCSSHRGEPRSGCRYCRAEANRAIAEATGVTEKTVRNDTAAEKSAPEPSEQARDDEAAAEKSASPDSGRQAAPIPGVPVRVESLADLFERPPEAVPVLGGRRLVRAETTAIAARAGVGKTTLVRGILAHAASGTAYCGFDFDRPLRSVYFSGEGSGPLWTEGAKLAAERFGLDAEALRRIAVIEGGGACGLRLNRPGDLEAIRRILAELKAADGLDLVAFDPFQRFAPGDENSSKDMGAAVDAVLDINREFEVATIVAHHASQAGRGLDAFRGHTSFEGAIGTGLVLTAPEPGERTLEAVKVRYARTVADSRMIFLDFDQAAGVYTERPGLGSQTKSGRLLEALEDGVWHKANDLADDLGVSRSTIRETYIRPAAERGLIDTEKGTNGALMVRHRDPSESLLEAA
jgi:hypothetical protein